MLAQAMSRTSNANDGHQDFERQRHLQTQLGEAARRWRKFDQRVADLPEVLRRWIGSEVFAADDLPELQVGAGGSLRDGYPRFDPCDEVERLEIFVRETVPA